MRHIKDIKVIKKKSSQHFIPVLEDSVTRRVICFKSKMGDL